MRDLYTCPRCGYETKRRSNMYTHLYKLKNLCPSSRNDVNITSEIKEYILANRVYYHKVSTTEPTISHTINVYNQMNNFISKMDTLEKVSKYTQYKNVELLGIDDHIESMYEAHVTKLDDDTFKEFYLDQTSIIDIIDTITTCTKTETLNIIHDGPTNKLKIYNNGVWESVIFEKGVVMLVSKVQSCYLDYYERYLLRRWYYGTIYQKQLVKERLQDYYKFLVCFELKPFVQGQCDCDILDHSNLKTNDLEEYYYIIYQQMEVNIKHCEVNKIRKCVYDVVKTNNRSNIIDLNNKMMDLFRVDESFKEFVLEKLRVSLAQIESSFDI